MAVKFDNEQQAEPQLTSLIDCVFLLLIFFLVSSQMKRLEKKLDIRLPEASVAKAFKMTPDLIRVSVSERGDLYVNTRPVGPGTLLAELRKAKQETTERRVIVEGDVFTPFRSIVQVLDACQAEGLSVAGIHTAGEIRNAKKP